MAGSDFRIKGEESGFEIFTNLLKIFSDAGTMKLVIQLYYISKNKMSCSWLILLNMIMIFFLSVVYM